MNPKSTNRKKIFKKFRKNVEDLAFVKTCDEFVNKYINFHSGVLLMMLSRLLRLSMEQFLKTSTLLTSVSIFLHPKNQLFMTTNALYLVG